MMKDVVVFAGSSVGSALALVRDIWKTYKINTYVICTNSNYSSLYNSSKFVTESINFTGSSDQILFEKFHNWVSEKNFPIKPVMYFTTDSSCLLVNNHRQWFEENFELTLPSSKIVEKFNQKGLAENEAANNGLFIPRSTTVSNENDIQIVLQSFQFPIILKPASAVDKNGVGFKVKIIETKNNFQTIIRNLLKNSITIVCQEFIPGGDEKATYYLFFRNSKGEIWETMGIKTLQSPPFQGIMAIGTTKHNSDVAEISQAFLKNIDYTGIGGIEYKEFNGKYFFIEMSTRLEGFFLLAAISGVPLGKISYQNMNRETVKEFYSQNDKKVFIDTIPLLSARRKQGKPYLFLNDILRGIFNKNVAFNIFCYSDMKPSIYMLQRFLFK